MANTGAEIATPNKVIPPVTKAKAPAIKELEEEVEKLAKELPSPAPKVSLINPEDYIPKPKEIVGANEAMGILKRQPLVTPSLLVTFQNFCRVGRDIAL